MHAKITFCHVASKQPYPHTDTHHLVYQLLEVSAMGWRGQEQPLISSGIFQYCFPVKFPARLTINCYLPIMRVQINAGFRGGAVHVGEQLHGRRPGKHQFYIHVHLANRPLVLQYSPDSSEV